MCVCSHVLHPPSDTLLHVKGFYRISERDVWLPSQRTLYVLRAEGGDSAKFGSLFDYLRENLKVPPVVFACVCVCV